MSQCRQIDGCARRTSPRPSSARRGRVDLSNGYQFKGATKHRFREKERNPYEQEHIDLLEAIRGGKKINELVRQVAESTLTAIMGRMSAYTGQAVTWDEALNSRLDLFPDKLAFGDLAVLPVAVPGQTEVRSDDVEASRPDSPGKTVRRDSPGGLPRSRRARRFRLNHPPSFPARYCTGSRNCSVRSSS